MAREWCRAPRLLFIFVSFSSFYFFPLSLQDGLPRKSVRAPIYLLCAVSPSDHNNILYRVWCCTNTYSTSTATAAKSDLVQRLYHYYYHCHFVLSISNFFLLLRAIRLRRTHRATTSSLAPYRSAESLAHARLETRLI